MTGIHAFFTQNALNTHAGLRQQAAACPAVASFLPAPAWQANMGGAACVPGLQGPVREVCITRLALRLVTVNGDGTNGGGGGPWQALLSGQLLLPISLHGVSVRLAPARPKPQADGSLSGLPAVGPAAEPAAGTSTGTSPPGPTSAAASGGSGKRGRSLRGPLAVLAHLPLRVEGLTIVDEVRSLPGGCPAGVWDSLHVAVSGSVCSPWPPPQTVIKSVAHL